MKTNNYIRNIAIMILLSMITTAGFAQETIYQNRRGNQAKKSNEVSQRNDKKNTNAKSRQDYGAHKQSDYTNHDSKKDHYQHKNRDYNNVHNGNYKKNSHSSGHHNSNMMHVSSYRPDYRMYHQNFNNHKLNRFHHRGFEYYHVGNNFYRYDPWHGYFLVDAPYAYVRHLPGAYFVRQYNGNRYVFANGFIYLPYENGYLLVPQPERPGFSLNIVLN